MSNSRPASYATVRRIWEQTPVWLRQWTKWSEGIGSILFLLGVAADALNWTPSDWGFFVNMYSSFVAFLIGVPVALIGLDAVSKAREQSAGEEQTRRLTHAAWSPIVENVSKLATDEQAINPVKAVQEFVNEWKVLGETVMCYARKEGDIYVDSALSGKLEEHADALETALSDLLSAVGNRGVINHRWISIQANWDLITTLVRERRIGYEMPWLKPGEESKLRYYFAPQNSPLNDLMDVWLKDDRGNSLNGMKTVPGRVRRLAEVATKKSLANQFVSINQDIPLALFSDRAIAAKQRLEGMRKVVQNVNASDFVN
jgi:hypothetical protein